MTCIIVDDEPLAIDLLEDFISKIPYLELKKSCQNAFEAMDFLKNEKVDLVFLDIQMPDITGIQFLKGLPEKPMVIFTTAYSNYAVESYDFDAIDYLLKPFAFERFLKAVNKAYTKLSEPSKDNKKEEDETIETHKDYFFVKADYSTIKINFDDILYIEGLKDYVKICLFKQKSVLPLLSLKILEAKLPANQFIRVHKSYIINLKRIESIQRNRIIINETRIPVGEHYKDDFFKLINPENQ